MANETVETPKEETGGIVTTVKTEVSSDLDFQAALAARKAEAGETADGDGQPSKEEKPAETQEQKPGEKKAPTGEPKKDDDIDDDSPLDYKSLSPREQKLVAKAFKQQRSKDRKSDRELRERVEELSAEISGLKKGKTEPEHEKPAATVGRPVRPRRKDFAEGDAGDEAFEAAMSKHDDDLFAFRKQQETEAKKAEDRKAADRTVIDRFNERADKFMETHEDYEDVMDSDVPLTPIMFGYMLKYGPQLGYHWGKNHEEAEKLGRLDEDGQNEACMRLVIQLEDEAKAEAKKKADEAAEADKIKNKNVAPKEQKKPEPPNPVSGRGSQVVAKDPAKMTFKEREKEFARTHPGVLNYEP